VRITDLDVTLFEWRDLPAASYSSRNPASAATPELGLVTIRTDAGVEGHAFLGASFRSARLDAISLVRHLRPAVIGQDPFERERLWQILTGRIRATTWRCIGAIDVALWDLAGKVAGLPIHAMIGTCRRKVPAYVSSSVLPTHEAYLEQAIMMKAAGFRAYKIHPPADFDATVRLCRDLRDALGADYTLMIDPSGAWQYPEALRLGRILEELRFHWYEDPLAEDDVYHYAKLREKLDIPLMATEYSPGGFHAYAPWLMARATDYLRGDVAIKGGLTAILKTAHLAEAFRMNFEIHHGGNSLNNFANLHVMMAIPNCEYFEVLMPPAAQKYAVIDDIEVDAEGFVHAVDGPGLGARIDFDLIRAQTTEVLRS
jgi:L-alanine-DL-glutamate epimerase-like enolase superfamily enzyme